MKHYLAAMHCLDLQPNGVPYPVNSEHCHTVESDPITLPSHGYVIEDMLAVLLITTVALIFIVVIRKRKR
jgi:hypothetical protein